MKLSVLLTCLVFVLGFPLDSQAQFTPVVAKLKAVSYQQLPDGSEIERDRREGSYFRSSLGSEMTNEYRIVDGEKKGPGRSFFVDSSTGKSYSLRHSDKKAMVEQKRPVPFAPPRAPPTRNQIVGKEVIGGLECVVVPKARRPGEKPSGKAWWSVANALMVKREFSLGNSRHVWELYDIRFIEPDPSQFGFPPDYEIDLSNCRGCE